MFLIQQLLHQPHVVQDSDLLIHVVFHVKTRSLQDDTQAQQHQESSRSLLRVKKDIILLMVFECQYAKTDTLLIKYYDSEMAAFLIGQNAAAAAMQSISEKLMRDFALYLQSKY